ncbi:transglutaminase domain-containing protein [Crossiella sp. NPDC003009]
MSTPVREIVARARRIPEHHRSFTETPETATKVHQIPPDLLAELTAEGLPRADTPDGPRYDNHDLASIAVTLRLPSPRFMGMRGWVAALRHGTAGVPVDYAVRLIPTCTGGCLDPGAPYRIHPGLAPLITEHPADPARPVFTIRHRAQGESIDLTGAPRELIELLSEVEHYLVPSLDLREDLDFVRRTRLADCDLAARYLAAEAVRLGVEARTSFGLLLAKPYSTGHSWLDIKVGDTWHPFDPLIGKMLANAGLTPPGEWPAHRSLGASFLRFADEPVELLEHCGAPVRLGFPTKRTPVPDSP